MSSNSDHKGLRLGIDCRLVLNKPTGIGSYILGLLDALLSLETGPELTLITGRFSPGELQRFAGNGRVRFVGCPLHYFGLKQKLLAHRCLNSAGIDVLLYPHHDLPFRLRMPTVVVVHHVPKLTVGTGPNALKRVLLLLNLIWATHRAKKVIAVSDYTAHVLRRDLRVPRSKIVSIYPPPSPVMTADAGAPLPQGLRRGRYFLCVAEWRPHKNLTRLVRAFGAIKSRLGPDWKLAIAGAPYRESVRLPEKVEEAGLSGSVLLLGKVSPYRLRALYENAAALVLVSLLENFGYPVVEAFQFGTPVICSNVGSLPEVAGTAALFVDPRNEAEIADAMLRLSMDPDLRRRLAEAGFAQMDRFSPKMAAERTLRVCEKAALGSGSTLA